MQKRKPTLQAGFGRSACLLAAVAMTLVGSGCFSITTGRSDGAQVDREGRAMATENAAAQNQDASKTTSEAAAGALGKGGSSGSGGSDHPEAAPAK